MGRKKKYIEMFGSFTEPFNCIGMLKTTTFINDRPLSYGSPEIQEILFILDDGERSTMQSWEVQSGTLTVQST